MKTSISTLKYFSRKLYSSENSIGFDWMKQEKVLMEPFEYIRNVPCKHHGMMVPAFNKWLQVPKEKLNSIQETIRTLITWNILLDDIQDDSGFRYGVPAAHRVFGVGVTINAATKALLIGQQQLIELGHPLAQEKFWSRMEEHLTGQGSDLYWAHHCILPNEKSLIEMIRKKSVSFVFPVELMQLFSTNKTDYTELAHDIGLFYYILDDYYNLFQPRDLQKLATVRQENHVTCSDITECKITLPIIHASQFPDIATELADILKQRTRDPKLQNRAIELLKKHGSDKYTRDMLRKLEADVRKEIDRLEGNAILVQVMDELSV